MKIDNLTKNFTTIYWVSFNKDSRIQNKTGKVVIANKNVNR